MHSIKKNSLHKILIKLSKILEIHKIVQFCTTTHYVVTCKW